MSRRTRKELVADGGPHHFDTKSEYARVSMCTKKIRFDDELAAIGACIDSSRKFGPMRDYRCPICHGWHITKKAG